MSIDVTTPSVSLATPVAVIPQDSDGAENVTTGGVAYPEPPLVIVTPLIELYNSSRYTT
jgi:hypothetical protein